MTWLPRMGPAESSGLGPPHPGLLPTGRCRIPAFGGVRYLGKWGAGFLTPNCCALSMGVQCCSLKGPQQTAPGTSCGQLWGTVPSGSREGLPRSLMAPLQCCFHQEEVTYRASLLAQVTPRAGERWSCQPPAGSRHHLASGPCPLHRRPRGSPIPARAPALLPPTAPAPPAPSLRSRCSRAKWHSFRVPLSSDSEMWANGGSPLMAPSPVPELGTGGGDRSLGARPRVKKRF